MRKKVKFYVIERYQSETEEERREKFKILMKEILTEKMKERLTEDE